MITGLVAVPATSQAYVVGVGDQVAETFNTPLFRAIDIRYSRYVVPYNVARDRGAAERLDRWYAAARAANVQPLITFNPKVSNNCILAVDKRYKGRRFRKLCHLPSAREYTAAFSAFRKRWPQIKDISPWNEVNHKSQPTFKNPKQAATYFKIVKKRCRGCKVVAVDLLDNTNVKHTLSYLKRWKKYAGKGRFIYGLHNYSDSNRKSYKRTAAIIKAIGKGNKLWITETGGIVQFAGSGFRYSPRRAANSVRQAFKIADRYKRYVDRLYLYNWVGQPRSARFDAGLTNPDGSARPAYHVVARKVGKRPAGTTSPPPPSSGGGGGSPPPPSGGGSGGGSEEPPPLIQPPIL